MIEMLERMASDRLWIYTGIAGSLFGAGLFSHILKTPEQDFGVMQSLICF